MKKRFCGQALLIKQLQIEQTLQLVQSGIQFNWCQKMINTGTIELNQKKGRKHLRSGEMILVDERVASHSKEAFSKPQSGL